MPFDLDNLSRGGFISGSAVWRYVTTDLAFEVIQLDYFADAWEQIRLNDLILLTASDGFQTLTVTDVGQNTVTVTHDLTTLINDPVIKTASFEAQPGIRYAIDTSGTAGAIDISLAANWPTNAVFRIQDVAASWTGVDFVTIDYIGSGYLFQGVSQNFEGNVPNDGESFVMRDESYGFELL